MDCTTLTVNLENMEFDWGGYLLQDGLAADPAAAVLEFTGDDVEIKTSATGKYGVVYTNNNTQGTLTLLMNNGTPQMARLRDWMFNKFGRRETFEVRDLLNGEVFTMSCAGFQNRAGMTWGNNAEGTTEVVLNFTAVSGYIAATNLQEV
jgi:hypothetical protein